MDICTKIFDWFNVEWKFEFEKKGLMGVYS